MLEIFGMGADEGDGVIQNIRSLNDIKGRNLQIEKLNYIKLVRTRKRTKRWQQCKKELFIDKV